MCGVSGDYSLGVEVLRVWSQGIVFCFGHCCAAPDPGMLERGESRRDDTEPRVAAPAPQGSQRRRAELRSPS